MNARAAEMGNTRLIRAPSGVSMIIVNPKEAAR
jgi:hypothetical protein